MEGKLKSPKQKKGPIASLSKPLLLALPIALVVGVFAMKSMIGTDNGGVNIPQQSKEEIIKPLMVTLKGIVKNANTGRPISGAVVEIQDIGKAKTNDYGMFSISVPEKAKGQTVFVIIRLKGKKLIEKSIRLNEGNLQNLKVRL